MMHMPLYWADEVFEGCADAATITRRMAASPEFQRAIAAGVKAYHEADKDRSGNTGKPSPAQVARQAFLEELGLELIPDTP